MRTKLSIHPGGRGATVAAHLLAATIVECGVPKPYLSIIETRISTSWLLFSSWVVRRSPNAKQILLVIMATKDLHKSCQSTVVNLPLRDLGGGLLDPQIIESHPPSSHGRATLV